MNKFMNKHSLQSSHETILYYVAHPKQDQQTTAENTHALVKELVEVGMKGPLSTQQQAQHGLGCLRVQTPLVLLLKGTRAHSRSKLIHSAHHHQTLAT